METYINLPANKAVRFTAVNKTPNKHELKLGYGAVYFKDFEIKDCFNADGTLKKWFRARPGIKLD